MYHVPLGPFELTRPVGKGGMGEVWRGVHVDSGQDVAVKVLMRRGANRPQYVSAFRHEIASVAALSHPNIVHVLDHGLVTPEAEIASRHRMSAGSPYLVMEYASHGSLADYTNSLRWGELRAILLTVLDSLAHAHARGMIHRDLKPQNVLVGCEHGLALTDFGLAHTLYDSEQDEERAGWGTPAYMAPEQFRAMWRSYGPWTDLYALGVMAYELATGQLPFTADKHWALGRAHIMFPIPPMTPLFEVPDGFERWIEHMMQKMPRDRFQFAADAAYALEGLQLGSTQEPTRLILTGRFGSVGPSPIGHTTPLQSQEIDVPTLLLNGQTHTWYDLEVAQTIEDDAYEAPKVSSAPFMSRPFPESWREHQAQDDAAQGITSAQLLGLREADMVGREPQRDMLWNTLWRMTRHGAPEAIIVEGEAGTGKTRLLQWLTERAHELGVAHVLKATHGDVRGRFDGLEAMFNRHLRISGLELDEALVQIDKQDSLEQVTDAHNVNALVRHLLGREDANVMLPPDVRYVHYMSHLRRLTRKRPVILWIEDLQWSDGAFEFVEYLLQERQQRLPILIVLSWRTGACADDAPERCALDLLQENKNVQHMVLEPLPDDGVRALIRQFMTLHPELEDTLCLRSQGVPLFGLQLLQEWVRADALVQTPDGIQLSPRYEGVLPHTIHDLWGARIQRILHGKPAWYEHALCVGAALGVEVSAQEWACACEHLKIEPDSSWTEHMTRSGLIEIMEGDQEFGWRFAHGLLRESLEQAMRQDGRWVSANHACAKALVSMYAQPRVETRERLAHHFGEAECLEDALAQILEVIKARQARGDGQAALDFSDEAESLLNRLMVSDSDSRRGNVWVARSRGFDIRGEFIDALRWAEVAVTEALEHQWDEVLCDAYLAQGWAALHRGLTQRAEELFKTSLEVPNRVLRQHLDALIGSARAAQRRGALERAAHVFESAHKLASEHGGFMLERAICLNGLGDVSRQAGHFSSAQQYIEQSLELATELGHVGLMADCHNDHADLLRRQGRYDQALTACRRAVALYDSVGSGQRNRACLNLAFILLNRADWPAAAKELSRLEKIFASTHDYSLLALTYVGQLPCLAHQQQWNELDQRITQSEGLLNQTRRRDADVIMAATLAMELAQDAQQGALAHRLRIFGLTYAPGPRS